jgi:protease I
MAQVLLLVAPRDFRDEELFDTMAELEHAGHRCVVASRAAGKCKGARGGAVVATVAHADADASGYDAVVFVGGTGAHTYFDDAAALGLARDAWEANKVVGAICIAPTILARAGLLADKRATVFGSEVEALRAGGAHYEGPGVVTDGSIVTASGPDQARAFGKALVKALAAAAAAATASTKSTTATTTTTTAPADQSPSIDMRSG